ncbi:hypothetical protein EUGRSUZ_K02667 [Eucalyptus grandis]|uniref:Uncharacterized protein n=2 Tax=Eucalyptus grandis TaxID=71139 RepID=A0A059A4N8_EUCGR|nr:hypothetical protein EUGRSUZ_K02667 [Eucalyptus grandis]
MCSMVIKLSKDLQNLPLHAPTFTFESQEMAVCCEDTDSTGMLIGLLIALVIAMLFFVICQPHPPRRFTVYRCN